MNKYFRLAVAITLLFAVNMNADAQFGGLKGLANKAKKAVTNKAEQVVNGKSDDKVSTKVSEKAAKVTSAPASKMAEQKFGAAPELPKLMGKDTPQDVRKNMVWNLRTANVDDVKALAAKLTARAKWNREVISAMKAETITDDYSYKSELERQLENWEEFYSILIDIITLHNSNEMKRDEKGWYSTDNSFMLSCTNDGCEASRKGLENIKMTVLFMRVNDKGQFVDSNRQPKFLETDVLEATKRDYNMLLNAAWLLEGYPVEWNRENASPVMKDYYEKAYQRALAYVMLLNEAIANNSLDNLEFKPMPKAGSLNAQLNAAALKIAKQQQKETVSVVITRSAWDVKKNALGVPICRVAYGYRIVQTKYGKRAVSCSWAQDYKGGSYGALRHYGVGLESFYVK